MEKKIYKESFISFCYKFFSFEQQQGKYIVLYLKNYTFIDLVYNSFYNY